ncbi:MAG: hypothetical protein H2042_15120 [Rhizobiales bacterium]|nr:hypothetical protein [Hyphomicrobiales bacterium]
MRVGRMLAAAVLTCLTLADAGGLRAQPAALTAESFSNIAYADIETWNSSGCSFAVFRGEDNLGLFDTEDPKKTGVFKVDGKLLFVPAGPKEKGAYWAGTVAGNTVRLIKGKRDPKYKNDGGGQGGAGRMEWSGPAGSGGIAVRWEEGC